ncbi:tryptophan-rich protein TspO-like [Symsagittifera roscoffensis]|uniref:tryptophan-rich protein TspO-like n=1 Tax=Symsagittifera roscoffensis TaxID=84072 RepID=UPI00307C9191
MMFYKALTAACFILTPILLGSLTGFLFRPDGHWFNKLIKPSFNPPGWLFAPVWTTLYALMGYASYRIWTLRATNEVDSAMTLYGVQLVVNMMFTPAFFGFHKLLLAAIICTFVAVLIVCTMTVFYSIDQIASFLLLPYLAWSSFATVLSWSIFYLNIGNDDLLHC